MTKDQFSHDTLGLVQRQPWRVGALCLAIADQLEARFNPVLVRGEVSGFMRAGSGHCYFTLKDGQGQIRAAMFRRIAMGLNFHPADGQQVEVSGRLTLYEQRGDLQLVVEDMRPVGQGSLMEAFLQLKNKLQSQGLFAPEKKRALTPYPRTIGVVTSLDAAALQDVLATLQRRVPHIPVLVASASVQGLGASSELIQALGSLYDLIRRHSCPLDVILLVRGGGALEDLWAFNDEKLAYMIAQSPVPLICGVGHETDFSIADFVADSRAPTPTAAAEICALPHAQVLSDLAYKANLLHQSVLRRLDRQRQDLFWTTQKLNHPKQKIQHQQEVLEIYMHRMQKILDIFCLNQKNYLEQLQTRLELLHPQKVLDRGFSWVTNADGKLITNAHQVSSEENLWVRFAQGVRQVIAK